MGYFFFEEEGYVFEGEGVGDLVDVNVVLDELFYLGGDGGDGGVCGEVVGDDVAHLVELVDDGRKDECRAAYEGGEDEDEGDDDAECA